ncbi:hypothetical protein M9H77_10212 [Catharanthus roseus]|uniref:Uncharacterized protein n=1 Tax=Catharanthus roseus TaxID=4058 RepID=A0ACC0C300_CATRO|nr:hypothetical protein M9H77_10212 [Catharanthus roseus]
MVLQAEFYAPHGGFKKPGFSQAHDYYSKNEFEYKDDHFSEDDYYESGSNIQMARPNISTSQPIQHFVVGPDQGFAHQESAYGKQQHQSYYGGGHDHSSHGPHGYPHVHGHGHGSYGKFQGGFGTGLASHGYPKPLSHGNNKYYGGASNGGYENHHHESSYMRMGPGKYESSYEHHDEFHKNEGRNRFPPFYEQHHNHNANFAAKDAEWMSKGL